MKTRHLAVGALLVSMVIGSIGIAGSGAGSMYGGLALAQSMGQGRGTLGVSAGIADNNAISGWFGYGMSKYVDGRVHLGFWDSGPKTFLTLGGDFKWQFWSVAEGTRYPIDMAVGGFIEYEDLDGGSVLQLGSHLIGSYPFKLYQNGVLSPYGRLNVRLYRVAFEPNSSNSDIKFGLNGGVAYDMTSALRFYGEFQIDGNDGVFFGVEFGVM